MVHSSLIACIQMGLCPLQIPNNRQLHHTLDTQKYCTSVVSMGSTALAAGIVLPRYGGLNYVCEINED